MQEEYNFHYVNRLVEMSNRFHRIINFNPKYFNLQNSISEVIERHNDFSKIIAEIHEHAINTRILCHPLVFKLLHMFIDCKKSSGTDIEKQFYTKLSQKGDAAMIFRIFQKRPVVFYTEVDSYMLQSGETGYGGFDDIPRNTSGEFVLENLISYDEMQISALMSVSVPTHFINAGGRRNRGLYVNPEKGNYIPKGIYVGSVGARFEVPKRMEWQHMIVSASQNRLGNGYGKKKSDTNALLNLWEEFYGQLIPNRTDFHFPTYKEVTDLKTSDPQVFRSRYIVLNIVDTESPTLPMYLDKEIYKARMRVTIEPFLMDANQRAKEERKQAYVVAVGLGLGVWRVHECQTELLLQAYRLELTTSISFMLFSCNLVETILF